MEISLFNQAKECGRKAFFISNNFKPKTKNLSYIKTKVVKEILSSGKFDLTTDEIKNQILKILEEENNNFELEIEKNSVVEELTFFIIILTRRLPPL